MVASIAERLLDEAEQHRAGLLARLVGEPVVEHTVEPELPAHLLERGPHGRSQPGLLELGRRKGDEQPSQPRDRLAHVRLESRDGLRLLGLGRLLDEQAET